MAIPPRAGTAVEWDFLSSGWSTKPFFFATLIIAGIARKVSEKEVRKQRMMSYIQRDSLPLINKGLDMHKIVI